MTWWRDAVVYEVYVRSFGDSDGDGVGDLDGVTDRLPHLADLGVDAVWLTPFYPSPGHDHGYDVSDYRGVDPRLGDLAAFDRFVARAHDLGLKVVVDVVPNHTSSDHPWFRAASSSPDDAFRDYYLWRAPAPDGGPPNNWQSNFGGPAWTQPSGEGDYYLHLFLPEQPDLNWRNPLVQKEFDGILGFWLDRGVDGFRIDVAHALLKHPDLPDNPVLPADHPDAAGPGAVGRVAAARRLVRAYDVDQDDVTDVFRRWRSAVASQARDRDVWLLGETVVDNPARLSRYVSGRDGLDAAMWFGAIGCELDPARLAEVLSAASWLGAEDGTLAWFLSNHDRSRPASRFGGGIDGAHRALAVASLLLAMPGPYLLYQGEELGCEDVVVDPGSAQDPIAARAGEHASGRDRARGPLPWAAGPSGGFTSGTPWLPVTPAAAGPASAQRGDGTSPLARWTQLLDVWRRLRSGVADDAGQVELRADCLVVARGPLRATLATAAGVDPGPAVWRSDGATRGPLARWAAAWTWTEGGGWDA